VITQHDAVTAAPTTGAAAPAVHNDHTALWAEAQIATLGVEAFPEYGSPAWLTLRTADPRRAAAIIEAAELWRRQQAREAWLDRMLDENPEEWFRLVTTSANAEANRVLRAEKLSTRPTAAEVARRRVYAEPRPVVATTEWPPIALPGRPGWWRGLTPDGRQLDLPRTVQEQPA
jgi:hypothetical protein